MAAAVALAAIGLGVALLAVSAEVAGLVALYGVITVAYSLVLKRLVILDVMTIASLFILRVVAGAVAVEAHASEWLLSVHRDAGPVPRLHQAAPGGDVGTASRPRPSIRAAGSEAADRVTRPVLEHYSLPFLDQMVAMVTAAAIISYAIYAVNSPLIGSRRCSPPRPRSSTGSSATCT